MKEEWERRMEKMLRIYAKNEREEKYLRFKNELAEIYKDTKEYTNKFNDENKNLNLFTILIIDIIILGEL